MRARQEIVAKVEELGFTAHPRVCKGFNIILHLTPNPLEDLSWQQLLR